MKRDIKRDMGISGRVPKSGHGGGETSPFRGMSPLCPDGTGDGTFAAMSRVPATSTRRGVPHNHSGARACVRFPDTLAGGLSSRVGAGAHNRHRAAVLRHRQRVLASGGYLCPPGACSGFYGLLRRTQKTPPQGVPGRGGRGGVT